MNYKLRTFLRLIGIIGISMSIFVQVQCTSSPPKPNFIVFFTDEMSPSYLGHEGGSYPTPNLDKLAAEGIRFTNSFSSAAMCTPSRYGVLTGQYPGRCIHPEFKEKYPSDQPYSVAWNSYITKQNQTLPRILSANGYVTGMAGKWHLGDPKFDNDSPLNKIDEEVEINTEDLNAILKEHQQRIQSQVMEQAGFDFAKSVIWTNNDDFRIKKLINHNFPWVTKGAVDLLKQFKEQEKPFFLYVANTAVHGPHHGESLDYDMRNTQEGRVEDLVQYQPPVEEIKNQLKDLNHFEQYKYAGMAEIDFQAGLLIKTLKDLNLDENTMFIFMSDHNVEPGKASCYQQGIHVPTIIKWPAKIQKGTTSAAMMQNVDILPTLLELAGIRLPSDLIIDGKSIVPVLEGKQEKSRDYIFIDSGFARAVTDGKFKYIAFRPPESVVEKMQNKTVKYAPNFLNTFKQAHSQISMEYYPAYFDQDQLYDLEADPYEQKNHAHDRVIKGIKKSYDQKHR